MAMAPATWTEGTTLSQGGPLVEVLQLSSVNTVVENGDPTSPPSTAVSYPFGILHKTIASTSKCSGNSNPTLAIFERDKYKIALLWSN